MEENYRILYVDDELGNLTAFEGLFFRSSYEVITANGAEEALEILEKNPVQLLITDQRMPDMTGLELLKIVSKKYPEIIKIILTGFSDIEIVKAAVNEASIFRYLNKPWEKEELRNVTKQALEVYQLRKDNKQLIEDLQKANEALEEKVKLRTQELSKANAAKDELFSVISHDLRSPMATLSSTLSLVLDYDALSVNEFKGIAQSIHYRLKNVSDLLENLLQWSLAQRKKVEATPENLNLNKIIENNIALYEDTAQSKKIEVIFEKNQEKDFYIFSDKNMTDFIIRNLLQNALKFTKEGGKIIILFLSIDRVY